ncbi:MAG: PIN domain-containing protein [Candidatus Kerfeldbacteria bacterium]|nr:PIN domain-containing protein [Candidatus Kerfeldbacteria bacterium]
MSKKGVSHIFIDADVILDLLCQREPHVEQAVKLFTRIENEELRGYTSPVIMANLFYLLRKQYSRTQATQFMQKLCLLLSIVPVNQRIIQQALTSNFTDIEDAIQYYAAKESDIPILVTRNTKDYRNAKQVRVYSPTEFLALYTEE